MNRNFYFAAVLLSLTMLLCSCAAHRKLHVTNGDLANLMLLIDYARINDTLYAGKCELTNDKYKIFLRDLATGDPGKYAVCSIDTGLWRNYKYAESLSKNYFRHPAFNKYPICCISWQGANEYCKWLTRVMNNDPLKPKITFRLPSVAEWMLLMPDPDKNGLDTGCPGGFDSTTNCYCFNFNVIDSVTNTAGDGGYYTVKVSSYKPNRYGIYNLNGNVAEMTTDSLICKGGSWHDSFNDCTLTASKHYSLPSPEVGFRVIAIVH